MEINSQIKKYRKDMNISQEELAEKVFVTRQTISNWENEKCYPDIHSLILLSSVFNVSLDNLIKGDIEIMKQEIKETDIKKMNLYGNIYSVLFVAMLIMAVPLARWLGLYAIIPYGIMWAVTLFFAFKVEKIKKNNDIQTYKEVVAFCEGKRLDEIEHIQEVAKRPYQKVFLVFGSAIFAIIVCILADVIIRLIV